MRKTLVAGLAAGTVFGGGVAMVAPSLASDSGAAATSATTTATTAADKAHPRLDLRRARAVIHATWTTRNGVHHRAIRGTVKAVSSDSITVKAKDGVTETYVVTSKTAVRVLGDGHKGKDPISEVEVGDKALVSGTGSTTARHVIARAPRSTASGSTSGSTSGDVTS